MKELFLIYLLFLYYVTYSSATLVNGIVTLSWPLTGAPAAFDRFLSANSQIQLKILCREPTVNTSVTQDQIKKKVYKVAEQNPKTQIRVTGRIGRVIGCLPIQSDALISTSQLASAAKDNKEQSAATAEDIYSQLWKEMETRTFIAHIDSCDYITDLSIDEYSNTTAPEISPEKAAQLRREQFAVQSNKNKKTRRATEDSKKKKKGDKKKPLEAVENKQTPLVAVVNKQIQTTLRTWGDGYYLIDIDQPDVEGSENRNLDVDVIVAIKNSHGGYITADEYPALVFYAVMCAIYALFALLWCVWCAFYWRELLKIQFWIGGVILIGMIEKSAFVAEYDTVNRHGYKVHFAIVTAEVLSCLKRTVSRMLVIIVALGYGIVKPRLGPLKQKVFAMGLIYFIIAATEAVLRINTKNDETNNKVLISRIPLAVIDATIYYWIFTSLVTTTRTLRLRKNIVKLNVYRHFTNTIIFAIVASLLFMIWSLKSHFFTTCITNWREFWVDDAFWHILFSLVLLVIMFLFRPSNNNQRYAFVPLLDQSDNDDDDEFDDDEEKGESAVFDSVTMRKASNMENGGASKNKKQQQAFLNREANVSGNGGADSNGNGAVEDALTWVEDNIPTSIADQALQALDSEDEIVNTKLERSKMQ